MYVLTSSKREPQPHADLAIVSRTRTFDTSNEVRLSNAFRKLEKTKTASSGGARRTEAQHIIGHGKAHLEHHRESQRSQSDSVPHIGQTPYDAVDEPPHEGSPERKRNSTEKAAVLQEAGAVGQPLCTATESAHEHEEVKQDRVSESKPSQSTPRRGCTPHRRQFSFVPGDDTTGDAKAPGNQPVAQNENSQEQSTGRQTVQLRQEARRSRSLEWI